MNIPNDPPFATSLCTPITLHAQLQKLDAWVRSLHDWANIEAERRGRTLPMVPEIPALPEMPESLMGVGIPSLSRSWLMIRAIRENWDWINRTYENDWDDDLCTFYQVMCVQVAAYVLVNAYLTPERYEARQKEFGHIEQHQMIHRLKNSGFSDKLIQSMGIGPGQESSIQFDDLFDPDEEAR